VLKFANAVLFNISWLAIVVTQSAGVALAIVALHLAAHFTFVGRGRTEVLLVALVSVIGFALDQLLFLLGVFNLAGQDAAAPLWLSCLWPVFATTLMHAFGSLQHRPVLAALIGAAGGALSYVAGTRLSAVEFADPLWGPVAVAALWALLFPLLLALSARLGRASDPLQAWQPAGRRATD
jgi:hypothetical protein